MRWRHAASWTRAANRASYAWVRWCVIHRATEGIDGRVPGTESGGERNEKRWGGGRKSVDVKRGVGSRECDGK